MYVHCQSNPSFLLELSGLTAGSNRQTVSVAGAFDLLKQSEYFLYIYTSSQKGRCIFHKIECEHDQSA